MLNAPAQQFSIQPDGQLYYQEKPNNPLPGVAVAMLQKGEHGLSPLLNVIGDDQNVEVAAKLSTVLSEILLDKLSVLMSLSKPDEFDFEGFEIEEVEKEAIRAIAGVVYDHMGVLPRGSVSEHIEKLTAEGRRFLRTKNIRFGPILVFQPMLNKPAAVQLRAVLWSVFNDQDLPAPVPADGSVSVTLTEEQLNNKPFYQAIGYPVYGPRAIRIDMLDRVINAAYEDSAEGKFKAQHKMAEWLGCSISDLYAILEDLGFKKLYDPADQHTDETKVEVVEQGAADKSEEKMSETKAEIPDVSSDGVEKQTPQEKPELATFAIKRGKLSKRDGRKEGRKKPFKKFDKNKGKRNKSTSRAPKQMSFGPDKKEADSPFSVLEQLKQK